jgi:hypothetical protein
MRPDEVIPEAVTIKIQLDAVVDADLVLLGSLPINSIETYHQSLSLATVKLAISRSET